MAIFNKIIKNLFLKVKTLNKTRLKNNNKQKNVQIAKHLNIQF